MIPAPLLIGLISLLITLVAAPISSVLSVRALKDVQFAVLAAKQNDYQSSCGFLMRALGRRTKIAYCLSAMGLSATATVIYLLVNCNYINYLYEVLRQ